MTGLSARFLTSVRLALAGVGAVLLTVLAAVTVVPAPAQAAGPRPHFQMPLPCGETWRLATYYGHEDYDIDMTFPGGSSGRSILASYDGTVTFAGWGNSGGWYVVIDHGGGWKTFYLHMIETPMVRAGQGVSIGQQLGRVGSTGNSTGPHLHYEQTRDGVKTESYFNGVPSGITSDGSPHTGPLYVAGPTSPARNLTSQNCGQSNPNRQVYESGSHSGWQMLPVNGITGSATASMVMGANKLLYTVNDGRVYEASSDFGWRNLATGISGVSNNALAVLNVDGVKYVYTVVGGMVHEAASNNGWRNLNTGISGVSAGALAAINLNGVKIVYTVAGGSVHEAASNSGWRNLNTGISGISASALAAISLDGVKIVYTVAGGMVHEAGSSTGWRNLNSGVRGTAVSATSLNGVKILYTV
ncbi:M23 family metallopeptidase [Micromonospora sp. KLBMP9576]|uniref:M23 family metallopeptidase n=1 Tax=Micromonospora sp. KLBMP9576 TaxID=3424769 RepID=UPI003D8C9D18